MKLEKKPGEGVNWEYMVEIMLWRQEEWMEVSSVVESMIRGREGVDMMVGRHPFGDECLGPFEQKFSISSRKKSRKVLDISAF